MLYDGRRSQNWPTKTPLIYLERLLGSQNQYARHQVNSIDFIDNLSLSWGQLKPIIIRDPQNLNNGEHMKYLVKRGEIKHMEPWQGQSVTITTPTTP
jgi:hypothetical protein